MLSGFKSSNSRSKANGGGGGTHRKAMEFYPDSANVLIVGETGKGKSTLINMITNYFREGTPEDLKVAIKTPFIDPTERDLERTTSETSVSDRTRSNTRGCWTYTFSDEDGRKITFIDTPGLGDTEGVHQDEINIDCVIKAAIAAGNMSAIIIVTNGTESRLGPTIKHVMNKLGGNLPDELVDNNLLLVLTKCSEAGAVFDVDRMSAEIAEPHQVFFMDNQAFSNDPKVWRANPKQQKQVLRSWEDSMETISELIDTIFQMEKTSTAAFEEMKETRDSIKMEISGILMEIRRLHELQAQLEAAQLGLTNFQADMKKYENFKKTTKIKSVKQIDTGHHNTVCMQHLQEKIICHEGCGLEFQESTNANHFSGCACMSNGVCTKCGCGPASHYHARVGYQETEEDVETILHDVKALYDAAVSGTNDTSSKISSMTNDLNAVKAVVQQKRDQVKDLFCRLKSICSRFNFVGETKAVIDVMRHEADALKSTDARKEAEISIKTLETLADQFSADSPAPRRKMRPAYSQRAPSASASASASSVNYKAPSSASARKGAGAGSNFVDAHKKGAGGSFKTMSRSSKREEEELEDSDPAESDFESRFESIKIR